MRAGLAAVSTNQTASPNVAPPTGRSAAPSKTYPAKGLETRCCCAFTAIAGMHARTAINRSEMGTSLPQPQGSSISRDGQSATVRTAGTPAYFFAAGGFGVSTVSPYLMVDLPSKCL